ncbi:hypothetical protein E3T61_05475 [Cryobacterium lactosi]|uniref:Uncharacterized protein n=1 Tax=Cryobacterium lactosi TaxID=1259202 RepID=A0A4V3IXT3_9MICO|nr:hypothetical protein [Cryobacterium lactosi]TFD93025.1 hypothetical protein E3T61_05475 [Cryobacterium lactosi]
MWLFDGGTMDSSVRGEVAAEFSQIYLCVGEDGKVFIPWGSPLGLVRENDIGQVLLTTLRQVGTVSVEAQAFASMPAFDPTWSNVVEFSITAGASASIDPWDPGATGFSIPMTPGIAYRVRFVVIDGETGSQQFRDDPQALPSELYLIQFWPQPASSAVVLKNESPWAQLWVYGALAGTIIPTLSDVPAPDRAAALIDLVFEAHPDTARRLRDGDERYLPGIIAYLKQLKVQTYHDPDFSYLRDDQHALELLVAQRLASK